MNCHRCKGLMCPAELRDWQSSAREDCFDALRCIVCGDIVDSVIIRNRIETGRGTLPRKERARHSVLRLQRGLFTPLPLGLQKRGE